MQFVQLLFGLVASADQQIRDNSGKWVKSLIKTGFRSESWLSTKTVLVMKLTSILILTACLHVSARGLSQTVTFSGKDIPLEKVFEAVKQQTGYFFFYQVEVMADAKPVSIEANKVDLETFLTTLLKDQPLKFSIKNKAIIISRKFLSAIAGVNTNNSTTNPGKLIPVRGKVFDEAGQPLSGANVIIKATGKGTITNAKGEFELPAVPEESPLVISFIGYAPQVVKVNEGKTIQVYLSITKNELDKVVVQAYGNTTQRLATSSISTVSKEQIERHPVVNVLSAIEGQVPGLVVTQYSGYASAPFHVELRGRNVINASLLSEPLYIIDGVPLTVLSLGGSDNYNQSSGFLQNGMTGPAGGQSPLFSLNPADVESVSVLKDADATAIYGSRAANGVILITTKKGKAGKTKLDLNVYSGASFVTGRYKLLNTQQYLTVRREALKNDGLTPNPGSDYDLTTWDTTRYTDFQKEQWGRVGRTFDVESSISGGDRQNTFRVGGGYHRETGILTKSGADQRSSVQFNLTHRSLNDKLLMSITSSYSYTSSDILDIGNMALLPPDVPPAFNKYGHLNFDGWQPVPDQLSGFALVFQPYTAKTGFLNSELSIQYHLLKGLVFSAQLGYSTVHVSQMQINPIIAQNPNYNPRGNSQFGNNNGTNAIVEPQFEYKLIAGKFNFTTLAGGSLQNVEQDGNYLGGSGYVNDNLLRSISNAPIKSATDVHGQYKYAAVFGRLNVNFGNKYIVNLSARRDGSSRFGPGRQFGNFGSVGAAWIFSEESLIKDHVSFLSFGKLRGSYGSTGSDGIGDYGYLSRWSASSTYPYQGSSAYSPLGFANPTLQWQVNKKLEAALDLGFFKDRLSLEVAWYRNRCSNQLIENNLPIITGFNGILANQNATIQNMGIEGTLKAKIIDNKEFGWNFSFNIGRNVNKIIDYPGLAQSPYASVYILGKSLAIRRYLHYTGVDPQTGQYTFLDKNHDGEIRDNPNDTANDLFLKDLTIRFEGGFSSSFTYKGLQLDLFFNFRDFLAFNPLAVGSIGLVGNQSVEVLNRWQKPGDKALYARYTTQLQNSDYQFTSSDFKVTDGSFIRLRNVSLSYDLPEKILKGAKIANCRVYARAENLAVFTKFKGIDPETPSLGALPPAKTITMGLQFSF